MQLSIHSWSGFPNSANAVAANIAVLLHVEVFGSRSMMQSNMLCRSTQHINQNKNRGLLPLSMVHMISSRVCNHGVIAAHLTCFQCSVIVQVSTTVIENIQEQH